MGSGDEGNIQPKVRFLLDIFFSIGKLYSNMKLSINAKCSDLFSASLYDDKGKLIGDYRGYVPDFFPGQHYGDYVTLEIDVETGKILNWKKPSKSELNKTFSPLDE
jgi:hypothetical protein